MIREITSEELVRIESMNFSAMKFDAKHKKLFLRTSGNDFLFINVADQQKEAGQMAEMKIEYDEFFAEWDMSILQKKKTILKTWFDDVLENPNPLCSIVFFYDDKSVFIVELDSLSIEQYEALMKSLLEDGGE